MIQIIHYRKKCIGCASCEQIFPERWRMSVIDGKSTLVGSRSKKGTFLLKAGDHELEQMREAEESCPVSIIKVS